MSTRVDLNPIFFLNLDSEKCVLVNTPLCVYSILGFKRKWVFDVGTRCPCTDLIKSFKWMGELRWAHYAASFRRPLKYLNLVDLWHSDMYMVLHICT